MHAHMGSVADTLLEHPKSRFDRFKRSLPRHMITLDNLCDFDDDSLDRF